MKSKARLLFGSFILSFVIVVGLTALSFLRINKLDSRIRQVEHSHAVINTINHLTVDLQDLNKTSFRYAITNDESYLNQFNLARSQWDNVCDSLRRLTADNRAQQDDIVLLRSDMALYHSLSATILRHDTLRPTELLESAVYKIRREKSDNALSRLTKMMKREQGVLDERTQERQSTLELTSFSIRTLTIVFGTLTIVLVALLLREFRRRTNYQEELQEKVNELAQSKRELEHIAYATSHDLQEPLRKIRIFGDRMLYQNRDGMTPTGIDSLQRVMKNAAHMQELVRELMILTSLAGGEQMQSCPLRKCMSEALENLSDRVQESGARIEVDELPAVAGNPEQLRLLFEKLLDNSLKFSRPGIAPELRVSAIRGAGNELGLPQGIGRQYHCITILDNGVGFDNNDAGKMFGIFRQLHGRDNGEYTGSGTGLAICQRIMSNHKGYIVAHGFPGAGAAFKLYFPA